MYKNRINIFVCLFILKYASIPKHVESTRNKVELYTVERSQLTARGVRRATGDVVKKSVGVGARDNKGSASASLGT